MAKKKVDNFQEGVKLELDGTKYQPTLSVTQEEKVQETELKQPEPSVRVETTTAANPRLARRQENANAYLDALAAKEKELGRTLTKQEIADWNDPKGLFAYQSLNNKKGNLANAFGANSLWGSFDDDTYKMLRKDLDSRSEQTKQKLAQDNKADRVVAVVPMVGGSTRAVTRGQQIAHQNLGNTITDANDLSPEQANTIVGILRKDHTIPEDIKFEGNTTLASVLDQLDDYVSDEELQALGYYNDEMVATVPHKETYEEMMARREKSEEAMRLQSQQKALQRQQARLGLADIAAGIGDIIKASGGALVDKRSYQDMYDKLTAQQQKNFDNYLARMEALKQEEKAKQKEAADRARQERLLKEQRLYNEQLQQRQWAHDEEVLEQKHKNKMAEIKARGQQKLKEIEERNKKQVDKFNNAGAIVFDGTDYTFDKARNNNVISQLLPIVSKYFTEENGYIPAIAGIEDSIMTEYGKAGERANIVLSALKDFEYQFSQEDRDNIVRVLTEYSNDRKLVTAPKGEVATVKPASSEKIYRNKETGEEVPESIWNTYRPSKKDLYEPVTA